MGRLARVEWAALAVMVGAVVVRAALGLTTRALDWDVAWYHAMAESVLRGDGLTIPWSGAPTHHYPPLYPWVLTAAFVGLGSGLLTTHAVALALSMAFLGVAWVLTNDLYGRRVAFMTTAVLAALPVLVRHDILAYPESLLAMLYAVTMWSIVKSLDKPPFILVAGGAAALSYLTKSSIGVFFIIAGMGGLAWRFYHRRWALLRDYWYGAAAAMMASVVFLWTWRNIAQFGLGGWETQPYAGESLRLAFGHATWPLVLLAKIFHVTILLAVFVLPFWKGLARRPVDILRNERLSALWLSVILPTLIATFFMMAFHFREGRPLFDGADARYLTVCLVPLLWLALGEARPAVASSTKPAKANPGLASVRAILLMLGGAMLFGIFAFDVTVGEVSERRRDVQVTLLMGAMLFCAVAAALLGERREKRNGGWQIVRATQIGPAVLAFGILVGALLLSRATTGEILTLGAAGAFGYLLTSTEWRAVAFAAILLGAPLSGVRGVIDWQEAFDAVEPSLAPGATVGVSFDALHYAAVFAAEPTRLVPLDERTHETAFLMVENPTGDESFPGWVLMRNISLQASWAPGSDLRRSLETTMGFEPTPVPDVPLLAIYEREGIAKGTGSTLEFNPTN